MTHVRDDHSISRLELLVLARLSVSKPPKEDEIANDLAALAKPDDAAARRREVTTTTLPALRRRGLVHERRLTAEGGRVLRAALGLDEIPTWVAVRDAHLPALELGRRPGTQDVTKLLKDANTLGSVLVRAHFGVTSQAELNTLCDTMLRTTLGMASGPVTLLRLRLHMLARQVGVDVNDAPAAMTNRIAARTLELTTANKRTMVRVLTRNWSYHVMSASKGRPFEPSPRIKPAPPRPPASLLPPGPPVVAHQEITSNKSAPPGTKANGATAHAGSNGAQSNGTPPSPPPTKPVVPALPADTLLTLVREAIPRIGSDGRFGAEKVFVSAIWRRIERDNRLPELSLERFKRWLVTANRDQLIDLARADLVGAMDAKLVEESEIEDLGATFHFVVDRRAGASGRGQYVR